MFGWGKKKAPPPESDPPARPKRDRGSTGEKERMNAELAKLGLLGIPGLDDDDNVVMSDDDEDLEDELLAMLGEEAGGSSSEQLIPAVQKTRLSPSPVVHPDLVDLTSPPASAKVKVDEAPIELPPEYATPAVDIFHAPPPAETVLDALQQRLTKYQSEVEKAGDNMSKARRMRRIVQQYEEAIRDHKKGKFVNFEELPTPPGFAPIPGTGTPALARPAPAVTPEPLMDFTEPLVPEILQPPQPVRIPEPVALQPSPKPSPVPRRHSPVPDSFEPEIVPEPTEQEKQLSELLERQRQFKEAALGAKHRGDVEQARDFLRVSKGFDQVILESRAGNLLDLNTFPRLSDPSSYERKVEPSPPSMNIPSSQVSEPMEVQQSAPGPAEEPSPAVDIFQAPPPPATVMEALQQRLIKYKSEVDKANEAENTSKARRMGRIVKQYEEAITAHKRGKPIAFDELPTPPGFAPIPGAAAAVPAAAAAVPATQVQQAQQPSAAKESSVSPEGGKASHSGGSINRGTNKPSTKLTLQEKQLAIILQRQKQFKEAAINAKQRGDIDQAREFLRTSKGFDKLIQSSQCGLPVDMATLPSAPDAVAALESEDFEIVTSSDCIPGSGSSADIFAKLEEDLRNQMKMCMRTRDHFKTMGDIASANRFEKMAVETKRDLDTLRLAARKEESIPKYHYETKIFSITECNSDLTEDEIEISVLKGINFKVPNPTEVDTFVRIELPYPSAEEAQSIKTSVVRNTNNPDYEATFKMNISRSNQRAVQRFYHRHGFKLEVWSKGGFLSRSTLLGVATAKLMPLETKCTLHDAFDVLDGRKSIGKLEVKIRIREPVLTKQITQKKEKWLSIDRV